MKLDTHFLDGIQHALLRTRNMIKRYALNYVDYKIGAEGHSVNDA